MKPIASLCLLLAFSLNASASGSFGGYSNDYQRPTDHRYETGKSLFKGRHSAYRGVKACIKDTTSNKVVKVKRKSLKPYKRGTPTALLNDLYNCDQPNQKLADIMKSRDTRNLIYYINKRYKLKLS